MKYIRYLFIPITLLLLSACGVNTTNPQASHGIEESKRNQVFICDYKGVNNINNLFTVDDAWIEYSWKSTREGTSTKLEKFKDFQLVLRYSNVKNDEQYLTDWQIREDKFGVLGRYGKAFVLRLNNNNFPDSFHFTVSKLTDHVPTDTLGKFSISRK